MSQAIITEYLLPTDTHRSRIKATCYSGSVTIDYPHHLQDEEAHRAAAEALKVKLGWTGTLIGGTAAFGYAFVFMPEG